MATKSRHLKTPLQLWIADTRKAKGYSSADLASWTGVTEDTARGWESRGKPSEDALAILERKFGAPAPSEADRNVVGGGDVAAAIDRQTAVMEEANRIALDQVAATEDQAAKMADLIALLATRLPSAASEQALALEWAYQPEQREAVQRYIASRRPQRDPQLETGKR